MLEGSWSMDSQMGLKHGYSLNLNDKNKKYSAKKKGWRLDFGTSG